MIGKGKSISPGTAALEYDLAKEIDGQTAAIPSLPDIPQRSHSGMLAFGISPTPLHHAGSPTLHNAAACPAAVLFCFVSPANYHLLSFEHFRKWHPRHNLIRFSLFIEPDTCLGIIQRCCLISSLDRDQKLRCICIPDISLDKFPLIWESFCCWNPSVTHYSLPFFMKS